MIELMCPRSALGLNENKLLANIFGQTAPTGTVVGNQLIWPSG